MIKHEVPTEEEIIKEVEELKSDMKEHDFQMGINGIHEKRFFNKINKILRMLKKPVRRVEFKSWIGKEIPRGKTSSRKIKRTINNRKR